jgi:hypothetical protein
MEACPLLLHLDVLCVELWAELSLAHALCIGPCKVWEGAQQDE